jgi:hypothetical protein
MKLGSRISLVFLILIFASGCAPYLAQSRAMLQAYYSGDFKEAADLAESVRPRKADRLLAYLDKGTVYHSDKQYKKSIRFFSKATKLAEDHQKLAALPQIGAVFANDNIMPFIASPYERLLIHAYQIMNYAQMGNFEDALVEVRRLNTVFPDIYSEGSTKGLMKSPFVAYLSGLIWEANRLCNDAYIDYKRVEKLPRRPKSLSKDLERSAICAGLKPLPLDKIVLPNLIIVLESGRSPVKISTEHEMPLQVIPVPYYEDQSTSIRKSLIKVDGKRAGYTESLEDVESSLKEVLEDEMPGIIARAVARLAVKEAAAIVIGEKVDKGLGVAIGMMALTTNRADLRSWETLPEKFQIWRGHISPGRHTILLELLDRSGRKVGSRRALVNLKEGTSALLTFRTVN